MSDFFFGIDTSLPDLSRRQKTPLPLSPEIQRDLVEAYALWLDAGYIVHPASTKGQKTPLNLEGCGKEKSDGTRGWGWGAVRDGKSEPITLDRFSLLVKRGRTHGICVLQPKDTTLGMLEVEARARPLLPKIAAAAKKLGVYDLLGEIVQGYSEESTRGGLHFLFCNRDGVPIRGQKLASINTAKGPGLAAEVIGAGGQFIAAPSCGLTHASGLPYTKLFGDPLSIRTITSDEQALLYKAFASINEIIQEPAAALAPAALLPLNDAVADFNHRALWTEILVPHGWVRGQTASAIGRLGTPIITVHWTRPGKKDGTSATTTGSVMCCFSSADETGLPQFIPYGSEDERRRTTLKKFDVFALLNFGGDEKAAIAAIRRLGYGIPDCLIPKPDESEDISLLAQAIQQRLDAGDVSLDDVAKIIPEVARVEVLVAVANRERRSLGQKMIPPDPLPARTDPRLRTGFPRLSSAAAFLLHASGKATLDYASRTLKRRGRHG